MSGEGRREDDEDGVVGGVPSPSVSDSVVVSCFAAVVSVAAAAVVGAEIDSRGWSSMDSLSAR